MIIFDTLQTALMQLGANKLRTGLTMLGIVIGVGAVIALMAAGQGAQQGVTKEVSALGSNLLFVEPGTTEQGGGPVRFSATTLTTDDADAIEGLQYVDAVISQYDLSIENQLVGNGRNTTASMVATEPEFAYVRSWEVQAGRFISDEDVSRKTTNVVLGAKVAEDLFDTAENAIGQEVRLSFGAFSLNLTVVGVMEERGAAGTGEDDTQILIPLTTFRARIPFGRAAGGSSNNVQQIVVKATGGGKVDDTKEDIRVLLLERHDYEEDFTVQTQNDLTATARDVSRTLTILLGAIAGISLVVGGIGIMNIMLVSVTERTREIGVRIAVGARRFDILKQFLAEASIISMFGGALGIVSLKSCGSCKGPKTFQSKQALT